MPRRKLEEQTIPPEQLVETPVKKPRRKSVDPTPDIVDARTIPSEKPKRAAPILTIDVDGDVETAQNRDDIVWHEIRNAHMTRKTLTGILSGIERTENGKTLAVVDYKGFRVVIPLAEMMINVGDSDDISYDERMLRQSKILGNMLGAEIDIIVMGIDNGERSIVASRKAALLKNRQKYYFTEGVDGLPLVHEGRVVQARILAVAERAVRVEIFGAECSIVSRDLSWEWLSDANDAYSVGDRILVRVLSISGSLEDLAVKADVKSVTDDSSRENLQKCRVQGKYIGTVTDIFKGVLRLRLSNGANAIAHSCFDRRTPGRKDDVSFVVTRIDDERGVAVGIITRIIKQNV